MLSRRHTLESLGALTLLSLAGCGHRGSPVSDDAPAGGTCSGNEISGEITVLAAASLRECFEEMGRLFEAEHPGTRVIFEFQGSQDLVASLAAGAQADLLATANAATMDKAHEQGLVAEPVEFATNVLALIVPAGNPGQVTGLEDGSLEGKLLVTCAPEVPCGAATLELSEALGIALSPVSQEQKVSDVRGKVESGEADAGIVYSTDAASAGAAVETITLPTNDVLNHYLIALTEQDEQGMAEETATARNTAHVTPSQSASSSCRATAEAFQKRILSEQGQNILQRTYGFGAPSAGEAPTSRVP